MWAEIRREAALIDLPEIRCAVLGALFLSLPFVVWAFQA